VLDPGLSAAVFAWWSAATTPCSGTWGGVTCAGAPGVVTHVQLSGAGLNGSLPDVWSGLVGLQVRWAGAGLTVCTCMTTTCHHRIMDE